ncbi:hypothetical protein CH373_09570 [Leptospira perolatii]|uniref:Uncharacterized protein n=1 Tax=Leptospira perolatii TaxID=2023191 RepID=A0A2M9ZMC1_9LEPT|nr:hypothetical protein [Leptospira perolatii]PJZ70038.1 hypothetical protein CH360_07315 [Leptospira perolatii]PJZ73226.1 hypothetical protein CH373_09570 [Leptospira perolatii]
MEIFVLLFLNAILAVGLYVGITAQVTKRIRTHMIRKINDEIRTLVDEIQNETESHLELLNSKVQAYKVLVQKSEPLESRLQEILKKLESFPNVEKILHEDPDPFVQERSMLAEEISHVSDSVEEVREQENYANELLTLIREKQKERKEVIEKSVSELAGTSLDPSVGYIYKSNVPESLHSVSKNPKEAKISEKPKSDSRSKKPPVDSDSTTVNILKNFGKSLKSAIGWMDTSELMEKPDGNKIPRPMYNQSSTFDVSLDQDPFLGAPFSEPGENTGSLRSKSEYTTEPDTKIEFGKLKIRDHKKPIEEDFGRVLEREMSGRKVQKADSIKISAEAALVDLGSEATKIEKVVFLLKKGYTHAEISEALDLALGEVDIIERFRLERNRRV